MGTEQAERNIERESKISLDKLVVGAERCKDFIKPKKGDYVPYLTTGLGLVSGIYGGMSNYPMSRIILDMPLVTAFTGIMSSEFAKLPSFNEEKYVPKNLACVQLGYWAGFLGTKLIKSLF